jgi:hypothetical protein
MSNQFSISKTLSRTHGLKPAQIDDYLIWGKMNKIESFCEHNIMQFDVKCKILHGNRKDFFSAVIKEIVSLQEMASSFEYDMVLVENASVVHTFELCRGCFNSGDFDMVASNQKDSIDLLKVTDIFYMSGWSKKVRRPRDEKLMLTFCKHIEGRDFYINLELNSVSRRYFREKIRTNSRIEKFIKEGWQIKNGVKVFRDNENFYHNLLHISIGHYYGTSPGTRLYYDINPYFERNIVDIDKIIEWAEEDGTLLRVLCVIELYGFIFNKDMRDCFQNYSRYEAKKNKNKHKIEEILLLIPINEINSKTVNFSLYKQVLIDSKSSNQPFCINFILRLIHQVI